MEVLTQPLSAPVGRALAGLPADAVRSLLVIRNDNLGDMVLFSGAFPWLRRCFPRAHITVGARSYIGNYLELCPDIDEFMPWEQLEHRLLTLPRLAWLPSWRGRNRLRQWLHPIWQAWWQRRYRFDLVLAPVRSPNSELHALVAKVQAGRRVGVAGDLSNQSAETKARFAATYDARFAAEQLTLATTELEFNQQFLSWLGADVPALVTPQVWTGAADQEFAARIWNGIARRPVLGLAPFKSSQPGSQLPVRWFIEVLGRVGRQLSVVIFGEDRDLVAADELTAALAIDSAVAQVVNLAGKTTVRQLIECLRRCDLILSQDTAALHLSVALDKPSVGLLGGGHRRRFFPWGNVARTRVVDRPLECFGCNWQCRFETLRCVQEISATDAAGALLDLYSQLSD